jgi:hypothetical protein
LPSFFGQEMTLAPGTKLGPYEILALIGAEGMGAVCQTMDQKLGKKAV